MGLCFSVPKDSVSDTDSIQHITDKNMIRSIPIEQKLEINGDPKVDFDGITSQASNLNRGSSRSFGSSESAFHDTQPWLDSDNDDDFHSINGDFAPSRGNTPIHGIVAENPKFKKSSSLQSNGAPFESKPQILHTGLISSPDLEPWKPPTSTDTTPRGKLSSNTNSTLSSPSDNKKLLELFRESRSGVGFSYADLLKHNSHANATLEKNPSIRVSANGTSHHSGDGSVSNGLKTPKGEHVKKVKEKQLSRSPLSACFPRRTSSRSSREKK